MSSRPTCISKRKGMLTDVMASAAVRRKCRKLDKVGMSRERSRSRSSSRDDPEMRRRIFGRERMFGIPWNGPTARGGGDGPTAARSGGDGPTAAQANSAKASSANREGNSASGAEGISVIADGNSAGI